MFRFLTAFALLAAPAQAHVGHLGAFGGHDHWVAGAAIGIAIGIAAWGALKGKKDGAAEAEVDLDSEEAEA